MPLYYSLALFYALTQIASPLPETGPRSLKTQADQEFLTTCSTGFSFKVAVNWRLAGGITLYGMPVEKSASFYGNKRFGVNVLNDAKDLLFVETWCSGPRKGSVRVHYIGASAGSGPRPLIAEYDVENLAIKAFGVRVDPKELN